MVYEVEFQDGTVKEYSANIIAENMLTQVDSDGYTITMMEGIVDYKRDDSRCSERRYVPCNQQRSKAYAKDNAVLETLGKMGRRV